MTKALMGIRWRLAIGLASLAAAVILTVPQAVGGQLARETSEIWPNALIQQPADVIWPNDPAAIGDTIWPNGLQVDASAG